MVADLEMTIRSRDESIKLLNNELKLKERDIHHLTQHNIELKDLLQNTVKEKASFGGRSHREGELIMAANYRVFPPWKRSPLGEAHTERVS